MFDNINLFINALDEYEKRIKDELDAITTATAKVWFTNLVRRTPKDTGFARMNWHFTINDLPPSNVIYSPKTRSTYADAQIPSFRNVNYGDVIYFFNNVEYIDKLENGWSDQAPHGMLAISMHEAKTHFNNAIRSM